MFKKSLCNRSKRTVLNLVLCMCALLFLPVIYVSAESHLAVPLDDTIYYVIEQARIRGLVLPLPEAKPYTRSQVLEAINEIAASNTLGEVEREILENARKKFSKAESGIDWSRGKYFFDYQVSPLKINWNGDIGVGASVSMATAYYAEKEDLAWGTDNLITAFTNGDVGENFSYGFSMIGHLTRAPRNLLGEDYNTYYNGFTDDPGRGYFNQQVKTFSEPVAFIPYTYRRYWDGQLFFLDEISASGFQEWPDQFAIAPRFLGEMSTGLLGDVFTVRFARLEREWGAMSGGRSLVFNGTAQPIVALETTFKPAYWFTCSSLTGALESAMGGDLKKASWDSQNLFSIEMVEYNYLNYFHFDIGTTAVYPKRIEPGYLLPVMSNFLYQNSVGDFDNMALFFNIKGQYPGIGSLWFSFFADEIDPDIEYLDKFFEMDRKMYAFQAGTRFHIPFLAFSSLTLSYTKVEPYCYTHNRIFVPWYNGEYEGSPAPAQTSYTSNGMGLGYYLNPNSDELLLRFETMPMADTTTHFQYQMIRHGANYGSRQVDGSSFSSELDAEGRNENPVLRKFFLKDGAYQWQHIFAVGASHTFSKLAVPVRVFGKLGMVYSFYTDIDGQPNSGEAHSYSVIDTDEYPKSTAGFLQLGFAIYM